MVRPGIIPTLKSSSTGTKSFSHCCTTMSLWYVVKFECYAYTNVVLTLERVTQ